MEGNVAILIPEPVDQLQEDCSKIISNSELNESEALQSQSVEENLKECNYFAEGKQQRIASMIKNGMAPEEAVNKESERYAQLVAQWTADDITDESTVTACVVPTTEGTSKESTKELDGKPDTEEEKSSKNLNNFTGGQIKRIVAMIKCGIEPEKARDMEQERYDKFATQKNTNADAADTGIETVSELQHDTNDSVALINANDDKPKPKHERFTNSQKRRIAAMIRDGVQAETARKFERIRNSRLQVQSVEQGEKITSGLKRSSLPDNSSMQPEFKKPRHHSEILTGDKKQLTRAAEAQSRQIHYNYEVAIMHGRDPEVSLTLKEIHLIKASLLNEIDKSEYDHLHHQFIENFINTGWWSLTCQNMETKVWIMSTVPRLKPWPNANIRIVNTPNLYKCAVVFSAEDVMPKNLFLSRVQKQNSELKTGKWRIINVERNFDNGETVTFTVDEQSKEVILRQGQKLWLNFSQVYVRIEPRTLLTRKRN